MSVNGSKQNDIQDWDERESMKHKTLYNKSIENSLHH